MVAHLVDAGHEVFVVDWGDPGPDDRGRGMEDYVVRWLPRAIEAVSSVSDGAPMGLVGYCLGGLFCLWHLGIESDPRVDRLAIIASPIDAHAMGPLMALARLGVPVADPLARVMGNVPGSLSSAAFQLTQPVRNVTRWRELWQHADDPAFVRGFVAMNAWMGDFASLPREIFVELAERLLRDNASFRGELRLDGRGVDLRRVRVPVLAIAGAQDAIVAPDAVHAIREVVGTSKIRCVTAPGGHAGVLAGSQAAREVWTPIADWMAIEALSSVA